MGVCKSLPWSGYHAIEANYEIQYRTKGKRRPTGSGAFSEVRACIKHSDNALCAVKTIQKVGWITRPQVMCEISILQKVQGQHPNIIEFFEYFEEFDVVNLVFEFCPGGTLEQLIGQQKIDTRSAVRLFYQLLSALSYLKSISILHRDIKPANLLLADSSTLKLADFGSACSCSGPLLRPQGTPAFYAPEMFLLPKGKGYSFPADMWATGVTMYMALFKGKHPFDQGNGVSAQLAQRAEFDVGWLTSKHARDLLEWLLMPSPVQRISPEDALQHKWFEDYGLGCGAFEKQIPTKFIPDSHGNWRPLFN